MSRYKPVGIRLAALISEAWRIVLATPVISLLTLMTAAAVCVGVLATTGQTVRAEQDVLARIDEAGTRLVVVIDASGTAGIHPSVVDRVMALSSVEWAIGMGSARDGTNSMIGQGATPTPVRFVWGDITALIDIDGRSPQPMEGLAGNGAADDLGLIHRVGGVSVDRYQIPIVGSFGASDILTDLEGSVLAVPDGDVTAMLTLRSLYVLALDPADVASLVPAISSILGASDPSAVRFETSANLADLRAAVAGDLGRYSRSLIVGVLAAGLSLVAVLVYGSVTLRRQDFGRRRALGAPRSTIVGLVVAQYASVALVGVLIGSGTGSVLVAKWSGGPPDWRFVTSIAVLALLASVVATLPPALVAASRDPVRVLRVP